MATRTKKQTRYFYKDQEVSKERLANIFLRHLKEMGMFYSDRVNMKNNNSEHFKTFIKNSNPCYWTNVLTTPQQQEFNKKWFSLISTSEIKETIDKFLRFLDSHNCRQEYFYNLEHHTYNDDVRRLDESMSKLKRLITYAPDGYDIINSSYCWADTKQGHDFWYDLDTKWNEIVMNGQEKEDWSLENADDDLEILA
jgi:hypothetical protein